MCDETFFESMCDECLLEVNTEMENGPLADQVRIRVQQALDGRRG